MGDLNLLLQALEAHRASLTAPRAGWPDESFSRLLPELPLFHRLGHPLRNSDLALHGDQLILEPASSKSSRVSLETDRCVFTSVGVAAYFAPAIVLAFGPLSDLRDDRISVPWDSKGAGSFMSWAPERHQEKIAQYSLPAAADETYLAKHLATCFQTWSRFLAGERPVAADAADIGVLRKVMSAPAQQDVLPLTTPEARYSSALDVGPKLMAVFVDADYPSTRSSEINTAWLETYTVLRRIVERRNEDGFHSLRRMARGRDLVQAAATFTKEYLYELGGELG
ncbi:hypothetical protein [Corallococcus sp. AB030]|uniref:hypothetical protein n=1 Tax=Corallococcus sp. AB030 TaxID=2316716 RepID=UPI0018F41A3C|nr:hypothetical protein [Corallococcus sp. AB030]